MWSAPGYSVNTTFYQSHGFQHHANRGVMPAYSLSPKAYHFHQCNLYRHIHYPLPSSAYQFTGVGGTRTLKILSCSQVLYQLSDNILDTLAEIESTIEPYRVPS